MSLELPASVMPFAGRIVDVDTHEMIPAQLWVEQFGEIVRPWAEIMTSKPTRVDANEINLPDYPGDVAEASADTVWVAKGPKAPGAADMLRRVEVMDQMAVDRQLMFPTGVGHAAKMLYGSHREADEPMFQPLKARGDSYWKDLMIANNEWAVAAARLSPRFRPVAPLYGETPEELISVAKSLIDRGIRAVQLITGRLPGGVSPAANALDGFYAMLAEASVPLTFHIGGEPNFFGTLGWGKAEAFEGYRETNEFALNPWRLSSMHLAVQNFVATMVTGGVFERHPTLRVGVMEYTAHWIGPLADLLDLWHDNNNKTGPADNSANRRLPLRPSEYITRNVRVAPFDFEPVGKYIEKHGLEDVYCFASDYPHVEGGKKPIEKFASSLEPLGQRVLEKFFVKNGELLLPN